MRSNRLLFLALVFFFICFSAEAAKKRRTAKRRWINNWLVGASAGINFAFADATPKKDGSTRQGLVTGIVLERKLSDSLYIQPEIRYIQKGVNTTLARLGQADVTGTIRLDALQFPLLFNWKFGKPRLRFGFFFGPSFSLALKRDIVISNLLTLSLSNRFRFLDFSLQAGSGIEFILARNVRAMIYARYTHGMVDIDRDFALCTRNIEISAGIMTRL